MNDNKITLSENSENPEISEIQEAQLSITFDDVSLKKGIIPVREYLETKNQIGAQTVKTEGIAPEAISMDEPESRPESKTDGNIRKKPAVMPKLPNNPIKKPVIKAEPPKPLSDKEVMEHTASVWQYKEIEKNGTEIHDEYHQKRRESQRAELIGARVRGKKHKHEGTNCDDYFETALTDDCCIAVVCDGAGSKAFSRIGSRVSSETAAAYLRKELTALFSESPSAKAGLYADISSEEFMSSCGAIARLVQSSAREAFAAQQKELARISNDAAYEKVLGRKPVISDLYTTFLAAVTVPLEINGKPECFMACVQIGDGCICALDSEADGEHCLKIMGEADSGAYSGETDFLSEKNTKPDAISAKTRISRGKTDTVLLMSDGVADDYFPAAPMMKRLYLDLCLNGILPMKGILPENGESPAPIRFKSVSMNQTSVELQYANQLLADKSDDAVNALWNKRDMLRCHSLEAFGINLGSTPEQRLRVWLDNYNERGSFDDRSLICVRLKNNNPE